jgi:Ca2+-binding EF-hand superfamily protein
LIREHFDRIDRTSDGVIMQEVLLQAAQEKRAAKASGPEKK